MIKHFESAPHWDSRRFFKFSYDYRFGCPRGVNVLRTAIKSGFEFGDREGSAEPML